MNDPRDPLESALREPAHLDDEGFTDGVMRALPPRRAGRRQVVLLAAGVAAGLLGAFTLGETTAAVAIALGAGGVAGLLLLGTAAAAAAAGLLWAGR